MRQIVLVIDDSVPLHKLVKAHLEPDELEVHSSHDGEAGLAKAVTLRPSLILLDVDMPHLDGFEVCRRLKANPITAPIPLIFLTADGMVNDKVKGLELGAADYVTKPFKPQELRARVRASLRAKHQLETQTMVDPLTGLWNRTYLDLQLSAQLSISRRSGRPLACMVADVDHMASLQIKHGPASCNEVRRLVGRILLGQCRAEDVVCRFDDSKFAILVIGANRAAGAHMADRLRCEVQRQLRARAGIDMNITCSFGVADTHIAEDANLFDRADAAAFRASRNGANCVFVAREAGDELHVAA